MCIRSCPAAHLAEKMLSRLTKQEGIERVTERYSLATTTTEYSPVYSRQFKLEIIFTC
jgi:hypothetical protein